MVAPRARSNSLRSETWRFGKLKTSKPVAQITKENHFSVRYERAFHWKSYLDTTALSSRRKYSSEKYISEDVVYISGKFCVINYVIFEGPAVRNLTYFV